MKLLDLYEDLFQYLCRLNRMAKTQAQSDYARIRAEVKELLDSILRHASSDIRLLNQAKRLELPTLFFVDNLVCTSRLKFALQWAENRLARERNELAGDEKFFDFLNDDLKDPSEEAAERLAVFYSFLGLGFSGMYQGQPDKIRVYVEQMFPRIRQWIDSDPRAKITEEAYRHTNDSVLTEPPSNAIVKVMVVFLFFALSVLAAYYGLYAKAVQDLNVYINKIVQQSEANIH
jgi:type IV/VI secretion system ImpK/VasF family protein